MYYVLEGNKIIFKGNKIEAKKELDDIIKIRNTERYKPILYMYMIISKEDYQKTIK